MRILLVVFALLLALPPSAAATNLSDAASALAPGTFVELTGMNGLNNGAIFEPVGCAPGAGPDITEYANKAVWNPVSKRFQFAGISHVPCGGDNARAVYYDDASNTWGNLPQSGLMSGQNDPRHTYDQNSLDPTTGMHFVTNYNSITTFVLANNASSWSSTNRPGACCQVATSDTFFPTFSGGGRMFHWDASRGLWGYRPSDGNWTQYATVATFSSTCDAGAGRNCRAITGGESSPLSAYSTVCNCMLFGGGSIAGAPLYKMDTAGVITQMSLSGAPASFQVSNPGSSAGQGVSMAVDPVSGFLITISDTGAMKQFDPTAGSQGTWTNLPATVPAFFKTAGGAQDKLISAGIPDYGVILYVKISGSAGAAGSTRVYLYKHRPSQPGARPAAPFNVTTQ